MSVAVLIASTLIWLPFGDAGATLDIQGRALAGRIAILAALLAALSLILIWRLTPQPIHGRTILVQTLAIGIALLIAGAFYYEAPDWDIPISLIMATLAYLTPSDESVCV